MKKLSLMILPLLCCACGPALTMEGARVKILPEAPVNTCNAISQVQGDGASHDKAEVMLRNHAGEMNANAVVVTENVDNGGQVRLIGKAYGCKSDS